MIKFFRKIRQKLLSENKFSKYILYAIGEIVLVVIGILIALQINNWNQKRVERNEELVILIDLKEDFQSAIEEFKFLNSIRTGIIGATQEIYGLRPNETEKYSTKYLDSLIGETLSAPTFNNKAGSLDVLLTSGKINLILNKDLKEKLIEWPGYIADMIEDEITHSNLFIGKYSDILDQYISWNAITKINTPIGVRFKRNPVPKLPENPLVSSDYTSLLSNMVFLNTLNRRALYCQVSSDETLELMEKAQEIISIIDRELKD